MSYSLDAIYKNSTWAISRNSYELAALQQKAATGQDINRISDDPTDSNQILAFKSDSRSKENTLNTLEEVVSILDLSSSVIQSMSNEFGRARSTLTSTLSGTLNLDLRKTLAADLNNALEELVALANTNRMGQSLFGGAHSEAIPYIVDRNDQGEITKVVYQGSYQEQEITITDGLEVSAMLVGDNFFRTQERQDPVFYGQTGIAAGSGTSSVSGDVMLTVSGSPGNWQLSIDGGINTVTVNGTETNVPLVHSETGEVMYLDSTGITQAGLEPIRVPGTYDIFNVLINARDLLQNDQELSEQMLQTLLRDTNESMNMVDQRLVRAFPIVGGRIQTLTNFKESIEEMKLGTDEEISRLQDTDITQVAIDLARYEVLYEMSLNIAARMFSLSLLDFLQ